MHTITSKLPDELYNRLDQLGKTIDRKKSYLIRKAVESFLQEKEDYFIALHRLEQRNPRISLEKLEDNNDLEN
ncbi:MAG: ribbon-helix-helix domain-containing protein [Rickettsia endosymbiont of Culicoides impunctatus]|uniref:type II toxin-antitoxin system RelB family antitoxin n=1 Tax=Candidatus Tisiphia endosymbiont of Sialis lutaria TaxID=2029164 RepID=UPI001E6BAAB6|nr:ribbon-helix-helix domain-containing protein [Rickettsia endosymbiont of Platyusa sonomae]MCC8416376.1 ribbon-helix-helix domain-containing protein [Rickettsia endosymbiont of Gnoriste bilineata]UCM85767.1 MAG: ribbon-helix-helix domain-containing protein [Rickettsia endosymbiont of Culicoides impunctatus]